MFPIHSGCLTTTLLHQTQTATQSCSRAPLLYPSLTLWASGTLCLRSTKQILFLLLLPKLHLILSLTETWIRPEGSATPAALSNNFSFSHTPHQVRKGGGTGLLILKNWKYSTYTPLCNTHSLESHAITVTAPVKLPCCSHLSASWSIGHLPRRAGFSCPHSPRIAAHLVFGDFNIHLDRPYAVNFHSLLTSFDLKRLTTTSTHKSVAS